MHALGMRKGRGHGKGRTQGQGKGQEQGPEQGLLYLDLPGAVSGMQSAAHLTGCKFACSARQEDAALILQDSDDCTRDDACTDYLAILTAACCWGWLATGLRNAATFQTACQALAGLLA